MLRVINPSNGQLLQEVLDTPADQVPRCFEQARRVQPAWAARPLAERRAIFRKFRGLLDARREELARTLTSEMGKPIGQARNELRDVLGRLDFFVENVDRVTRDELVFDEPGQALRERISWEPLGVIASISAWNYPYFVGSNVFVPALLTGNAVLYKSSEFCPLTGLAIERLLRESGVPEGAFQCLVGGGAIGAALVGLPVDGIFFTGSYATGRRLAEAAAGRMIRVQLELGGKDPAYVCEDVDVPATASALADGAFYNTGQSCCAVERIYVHGAIHDAFVEAFLRTVLSFVMGDPLEEGTTIGPLTREAQLAVLDDQVKDALAKGARLLCGGRRAARPGNYFEPTVLVDVDAGMTVMKEESFGPIIGIQRVASDEEALELMNDTVYGLTAGVYTSEAARAERLLAGVRTGSVYWNCCDRVSPRLPWSGRGHSGVGSTLSTLGIQAFVQPKAWHLKG